MGTYCDDYLTLRKARKHLGDKFEHASDYATEKTIQTAQDLALTEGMSLKEAMKSLKRQRDMDP